LVRNLPKTVREYDRSKAKIALNSSLFATRSPHPPANILFRKKIEQKLFMLTLEEKIQNLETIIQQKNYAPADKQILLKEIERLKQELNAQNGAE